MVEEKRETVVVDKDRSTNPLGWVVGIVLLVLLILFIMSGGFGLFGGGDTQTGDTTNVEAPDTVNVQPSTGQ